MKFHSTQLSGVWFIEPESLVDERGFFARTWCLNEFARHGLSTDLAQCSVSFNVHAGTLRGLHFQRPPHAETKVVRCTRGAIWDVAVDLRPDSVTYCQWYAAELSADNHRMLYIPEGFAHGFQTLSADSEVLYQISTPYHGPSAAGVRWDDAAFGIQWPQAAKRVMSPRDAAFENYVPHRPQADVLP